MIDLQELKRMAKLATPGPWGISKDGQTVTSNQYHPVVRLAEPFHRQCKHGTGQDAEFIAAANPQAILELIERLERAEAPPELNWIDVKTSLPDEFETVLVTGRALCGSWFGINRALLRDNEWHFEDAEFQGGCDPDITDCITHWIRSEDIPIPHQLQALRAKTYETINQQK
jgi:hypothetical protein